MRQLADTWTAQKLFIRAMPDRLTGNCRGAISGALKKKLGPTVGTTRTREVGPNKTGARGSATTYRIVT